MLKKSMSINPSRLLAQCPLCQASYQEERIRFLGERGTTRLFHCTCQICGHAMLAIILENAGWVSSVGMVTDLEAKDAEHFQTTLPITADECIRAHQVLEFESRALCAHLTDLKTTS